MSPKVRVDLRETGCSKPNCKHRFSILNRHHKRHEKKWINLFNRLGPPYDREISKSNRLLRLLRERYYSFRERDLIRICEWHHVEIHIIYDRVYEEAEDKFLKDREDFGWREAIWCMYKCKKLCNEWIKIETPGVDPKKARRAGKWSDNKKA